MCRAKRIGPAGLDARCASNHGETCSGYCSAREPEIKEDLNDECRRW
jgi:hypothetical protein